MSGAYPPLPPEVERALARATRLEWWTIAWLLSIVLVMGAVTGSSQAMKAAWIEDMLSLLPPAFFLLARYVERREPTKYYPFGFHRAGSLAFFLAAAALAAMGSFLVYEAVMTLSRVEHPTISSMTIRGEQVWMGWLMMAALVYSVIPPVILGIKKKRLARQLQDQVLYTDAAMNAADWMTGLAGILGILGVGLGFWWADAAAAGLIGLDILRDGLRNVRVSVAELLDGAPRAMESSAIHPDVARIEQALRGEGQVRVRQTGRFLQVQIADRETVNPPPAVAEPLIRSRPWRLISISAGGVDLARRALARNRAAAPGQDEPDGAAQTGTPAIAGSDPSTPSNRSSR